ncbi:MAG: HEAT repeat domain-containing protein [Planctomycetota bacterium]
MNHRPILGAFALLALSACSSTSGQAADASAVKEAEDRKRLAEETEARLADPSRMLLDLDKALDKYLQYRLSAGSIENDTRAQRLQSYLDEVAKKRFAVLVRLADQSENPHNRAIACAALGFAKEERDKALQSLVNAVMAKEDDVVDNAVFGLGILAHKDTPPGLLETLIDSAKRSSISRGGAAWSLYEVQQAAIDQAPFLAIWRKVLDAGLDGYPPEVLVSALRGIGQSRDRANRERVERFVSHPMPLVRAAAAIALGRLNDPAAVPVLLALIGPGETNQNVRLAARKALQALAGDVDHGYDVDEWKREFDRGH